MQNCNPKGGLTMSVMKPVTRRDIAPWAGFGELENRLQQIFNNWPAEATSANVSDWIPAVDLAEEQDRYILTADLPGVTKEDIDLSLTDDVLTLKGSRKAESEEKKKGYHRVERSYGSFQRSFRIPGGVDGSKIEANFKHGVLNVVLPKPEESRPRQIDVKIG